MKTVLKMILLFLLALNFSSCKTKEKVTERFTEKAQANTSDVVKTTGQTECQVENNSYGETTHTQWSDSIVEKFHERIVTDSSGNVLWHETEHSKDHYVGKSHNKTNQSNSSQETATAQNVAITQEQKDSVYNGGVLQEVTVVKSKPCKWLWYVGLLALILVCAVIYKIKK